MCQYWYLYSSQCSIKYYINLLIFKEIINHCIKQNLNSIQFKTNLSENHCSVKFLAFFFCNFLLVFTEFYIKKVREISKKTFWMHRHHQIRYRKAINMLIPRGYLLPDIVHTYTKHKNKKFLVLKTRLSKNLFIIILFYPYYSHKVGILVFIFIWIERRNYFLNNIIYNHFKV